MPDGSTATPTNCALPYALASARVAYVELPLPKPEGGTAYTLPDWVSTTTTRPDVRSTATAPGLQLLRFWPVQSRTTVELAASPGAPEKRTTDSPRHGALPGGGLSRCEWVEKRLRQENPEQGAPPLEFCWLDT